MELRLGTHKLPVVLEGEGTQESPHTGRPLRTRRVSFVVIGEEANDQVVKSLSDARGPGGGVILAEKEIEARFQVSNSSRSYSNHSDSFSHTLELEELRPEKVILAEQVELEPYRYEERLESGAIIISLRTRLGSADSSRLDQLAREMAGDRYFPVVRRGLQEQPLQMRFGMCLWSRHGEEIKHDLTLVEQAYDGTDHPLGGLLYPQVLRLQQTSARSAALIDALLGALVERGVLTDSDVESIKAGLKDQVWMHMREFDRMDDVDAKR